MLNPQRTAIPSASMCLHRLPGIRGWTENPDCFFSLPPPSEFAEVEESHVLSAEGKVGQGRGASCPWKGLG